jgi:predicted enzyme related to lactoylglutathione lyase
MSTGTQNGIKLKDIAFTAYGVNDMSQARQFYEGIIGLSPADNFGGMWQEYTIGNGTFAIIAAGDSAPDYFKGRGFALALEAEDLDAAFEVIRKNNVKVLQEPQDFPGCRMFVISDPDNNAITFHQIKKQ